MKYFALVVLFYCSAIVVSAQSARVFFISDDDVNAFFYRAIDNGYNDKVFPMEVSLKSGKAKTMIFGGFQNWEMIHCAFSNGQDCELLLFPHDEVTVYVSSQGIRFEGSNAAGLQFFYDEFTSVGHRLKYLNTIDTFFAEYINRQRSIRSITPAINEKIIYPQLAKLQHLKQEQTIQPVFYEKLSKNMEMLLNGYITERITTLLKNKKYRNIALKDSAVIMHIADSIYQKHPITDNDLIKFNYRTLYIPQYLYFYYNDQPIEIPGYDIKAFGPYGVYLHAPQFMQAALLGGACMTVLKYHSKDMDLPVIKCFFYEHFPQSPYVYILNTKVKDENIEEKPVQDSIIYIKEQPKTMIELVHLPECDGKYLFVDLWATWCAPCKTEFQYNRQLNELLSQWNKVSIIYISIDGDKQEQNWKEDIEKWKLVGMHLLASESLITNIQTNIYVDGKISIPRYILISPNGEILHKDLPRPSEMAKLKATLKQLLN